VIILCGLYKRKDADNNIVPFPARSSYDLVGVDNFRIAFILIRHLLEQGCKTVRFVTQPYPDPSIQLRIFGYLQALGEANIIGSPNDIFIEDIDDADFVRWLLDNTDCPGIFYANDKTAAKLMHMLTEHDYKIPLDVRIVGVDDIKYANYLRVPLTTYKQPCK